MQKKFILILTVFILLNGCNHKEYIKKTNYLSPISDKDNNLVLLLNTDLKLITVDNDLEQQLLDKTQNIISKYHKIADAYHYYKDEEGNLIPNLKLLNDAYAKEPIKVNEELITLLKEAINLSILTQGYFNPSIGALSNLWKNKFTSLPSYNEDPAQKDIDNALACQIKPEEFENILIIDEINLTIHFKKVNSCQDKVIIDLGAVSKGLIIDLAGKELEKYNTSFLLDAGSSSIITHNNEKENINWSIGVRSPDNGNLLFALSANNKAVSTSGDDQQYFLLKQPDGSNIRRHHILDPYTGYSQNYYRSITLVADYNAGMLDALSTALYNIEDENTRQEIIKNIEKYYNLEIGYAYISDNKNGYIMFINKNLNDILISEYSSDDIKEIIIS